MLCKYIKKNKTDSKKEFIPSKAKTATILFEVTLNLTKNNRMSVRIVATIEVIIQTLLLLYIL